MPTPTPYRQFLGHRPRSRSALRRSTTDGGAATAAPAEDGCCEVSSGGPDVAEPGQADAGLPH